MIEAPTTRWEQNHLALVKSRKALRDLVFSEGFTEEEAVEYGLLPRWSSTDSQIHAEMTEWCAGRLTGSWNEFVQINNAAAAADYLRGWIAGIDEVQDYLSSEMDRKEGHGANGRNGFLALLNVIVEHMEINVSQCLPLLRTALEDRLEESGQTLLFPVPRQQPSEGRAKCGGKVKRGVRYAVLVRDNSTCQRCGAGTETKLEVDHKTPHSFTQNGSADSCRLCTFDNLWTLCGACNRGKGNRYDDGEGA